MADPNPWLTPEQLAQIGKNIETSLFQEFYLNQWREEQSKRLSLMGLISPGMQESWITNALASNEWKPPRSLGPIATVWRGGRITPLFECGEDTTPRYAFTVWRCVWNGKSGALRTVNFYSSSRTSPLSRTGSPLGYECEMCTFPTARRCSVRTLFTMHASKVFKPGLITAYAVMDANIPGPLIFVDRRHHVEPNPRARNPRHEI